MTLRLRIPLLTIVATVLTFSFAAPANAQKRDHLTDEESELIRFHQQLDKRIEVFIRAIDRRWAIINGVEQVKPKSIVKGEPEWGFPPKGSRAQLLSDIAALLDEAITNIDDVSQHDEKSPLISRSLRRLTTAANGYVAQLNTLRAGTKDADELAAIERALDHAAQIIEAGNQLPPPSDDKKKKNDP